MAEEEQAEGGEKPAPVAVSAGGGANKLGMIVSIVNLVGTLAIVALLMLSHQKEKQVTSVEDIVAGQAEKKDGHGGEKKDGHGEKKADGHGGGHGDGHGGKKSDEVAANIDAGRIINMDPFTVNLTTGSGTQARYVRMNLSIELEKGAEDAEFKVKTPRVRDTVINMLNSKRPSDISSPEGRELLKDEVRRALNSFMTISKVKGVYFTNFAISN